MSILINPGNPEPLGLSIQGNQANFAVFSTQAPKVTLGLKAKGRIQEIPLNRSGEIWHVAVQGWTEGMEYAFQIEPNTWLADPYSRTAASSAKWGQGANSVWSRIEPLKPFDWQKVLKPAIPLSDLIIYEMHVRSFTIHPSSGAAHPGTYLGIVEKIPYLRKLGVNAVELMPVFEFDETRTNPEAQNLVNLWGYDPLSFFCPMRRYASGADPVTEFKTMVRELHRNGIEVILDVVYNHTGEAGDRNYVFSFRGLDDGAYYMLDSEGRYRDYSGCKNTFNANHPAARKLILSSLRFWAEEMQVDGFRFDLASVLTRGQNGAVLEKPPLIEAISRLHGVKLISESWDAAGLYQVGQFPNFGPWSEWNGKFRDQVRNFIKGTDGFAGQFADVLCGSEFLYRSKSPLSSINFVTAHDGFSLNDLVSYNQKHNEANEQQNQDGSDQNFSWNCGVEGPTNDPVISQLRERQMRNFLLSLFLSRGVPMLLMGDEYGHSRRGNNNPYVQDNEINWFLWDEMEKKTARVDFVSSLIAFRKKHPELRGARFLTDADIVWHNDWSPNGHLVSCTLQSKLFLAFNANPKPKDLTLPGGPWQDVVRTERPWQEHYLRKRGPPLEPTLQLPPYSALLGIAFSVFVD